MGCERATATAAGGITAVATVTTETIYHGHSIQLYALSVWITFHPFRETHNVSPPLRFRSKNITGDTPATAAARDMARDKCFINTSATAR